MLRLLSVGFFLWWIGGTFESVMSVLRDEIYTATESRETRAREGEKGRDRERTKGLHGEETNSEVDKLGCTRLHVSYANLQKGGQRKEARGRHRALVRLMSG